ncbi:GNAT family N-acetyltransferase [Pyxidicoccus fallax]|uniref:GNAT family N-acetyltransferase n=1 Tax=Pyxidicoccus fallax TaxID=394095 RepID=A0A848LGL3_9BACT|nr:GNAT family N-acetyltransferase [Pyxidicoccus fallax]NMO15158.1 GNAT family N-acetyltransferase [Pyxidicoccus fallax]NPC77780.1 GNAT family N-acetyltransferase [Pyxidicoccus fallax]
MSPPLIETVKDDAALRDWVDIVNEVDVWGVLSFEDARYRSRAQGRTEYVLRVDGQAVGAAFLQPPSGEGEASCAVTGLWVRSEHRRRGLGTALHHAVSAEARRLGADSLEVEAYESQEDALRYLEHRGYREQARHTELMLELEGLVLPEVCPPPGIHIVTRAERPDLLRGMYAVAQEAIADIPGEGPDAVGSFEEWLATDLDRPPHTHDLTFIALHGDEVVGYAVLQRGQRGIAFHSLTGVKRAWRGQGIASALKRAQLAGAQRAGFQRVVTENHLDNAPIRHLNETFGYRPLPGAILFRGPLLPAEP